MSKIIQNKKLSISDHNKGLNLCDKCKHKDYSESLIWLTSEDFKPLDGEVLKDEAFIFDAVCQPCYKQLLVGV